LPSNPYLLSIILYEAGSTTPATSKLVIARDETTSESISALTNGSGEVILNLANLTSGYTVGDVITIYSKDGDNTVYTQHTTSIVGSYSTSLTYIDTSVSETTDLRYFTASDFRDFFSLDAYNATTSPAGIRTEQITQVGVGVEAEIDRMLNQKFDDNGGSYYTSTNEYHDVNEDDQSDFITNYAPIISLSKFEVNSATEGDTADWTDLVAESEDDYSYDNSTGRVRIENADLLPALGANQIRLTYTYGAASVPSDIKRLAIIMTAKELAQANLYRLSIAGTELERSGGSINIQDTAQREIDKILNNRGRRNVINC